MHILYIIIQYLGKHQDAIHSSDHSLKQLSSSGVFALGVVESLGHRSLEASRAK